MSACFQNINFCDLNFLTQRDKIKKNQSIVLHVNTSGLSGLTEKERYNCILLRRDKL